MMTYSARRCLVIPDVHQDIAWVDRILAREPEADLIVFLGDYFDSRRSPEERANVAETCAYLDALRVRLGDRGVFLLGNHDVQYLEARADCLAHRTPRHLRYKCGASFVHSAAKQISKTLSSDFWSATRLFVSVNGWLLSHAGVAPAHWPARATLAESLVALEGACSAALQSITAPVPAHRPPHPLLQAGYVRGGDTPVGGLTWLDWDHEFGDAPPAPQLVGHTVSPFGARQSGRSWCLDGGQTCYGVLEANELEIASA